MHGDQFNQFFINIKFTITGPDEDCKLSYSSDVNGLINSNRKILMILSSIVVTNPMIFYQSVQKTVFLINEVALAECAFSGHIISTDFIKHCIMKFLSLYDFQLMAQVIAFTNGSDIPFMSFCKTSLLLYEVSLQFLESWNTHLAFIFIV